MQIEEERKKKEKKRRVAGKSIGERKRERERSLMMSQASCWVQRRKEETRAGLRDRKWSMLMSQAIVFDKKKRRTPETATDRRWCIVEWYTQRSLSRMNTFSKGSSWDLSEKSIYSGFIFRSLSLEQDAGLRKMLCGSWSVVSHNLTLLILGEEHPLKWTRL